MTSRGVYKWWHGIRSVSLNLLGGGRGAEEGKGEGLGFKGLAKMNIVSLADYICVFSRRRGNYGADFERKIWRREEGECWV